MTKSNEGKFFKILYLEIERILLEKFHPDRFKT